METRQIASMEITDERIGDGVMLRPLVEEVQWRCLVKKVVDDDAYESRENFTFLEKRSRLPLYPRPWHSLLDPPSSTPLFINAKC